MGATLTYLMTRRALAPVAGPIQDTWERVLAVFRRPTTRGDNVSAMHATGRDAGGGRTAEPTRAANPAFEEYRSAALRKLDEEERQFREFLDRLRFAKDRAEFDEFMSERRSKSGAPEDGETVAR